MNSSRCPFDCLTVFGTSAFKNTSKLELLSVRVWKKYFGLCQRWSWCFHTQIAVQLGVGNVMGRLAQKTSPRSISRPIERQVTRSLVRSLGPYDHSTCLHFDCSYRMYYDRSTCKFHTRSVCMYCDLSKYKLGGRRASPQSVALRVVLLMADHKNIQIPSKYI